ncbi:MAG: cell division protein ZapA [Desulfohalobiaceae bacterium]
MHSYHLSILGHEIAFRTNAEEERIREAERLIAQRFKRLDTHGSRVSNEKLLILVALSLADDYLQTDQKLRDLQVRIQQLLDKIEAEIE